MLKPNLSIKEIDFDILEQVEKHPGITAVELGQKVHISRFTALTHTEKLENLQLLRRKQAKNGTYSYYSESRLTLETIQQIKRFYEKNMVDSIQDNLSLSDLQDLHLKLIKLNGKPRKTLIDIAQLGVVSCQELAKLDGVSSSAIDKRLTPLKELKLVERRQDKFSSQYPSYIYSLFPPLTSELIDEALNFPGLPSHPTSSCPTVSASSPTPNIDNSVTTPITANNLINSAVSPCLESDVSTSQDSPDGNSFKGLTTDEFLDKILDKLIEFKQDVRLLKDCFQSLEARIESIEQHLAKESNGQATRNQLDQKMQLLFSSY